MYRKWPFRDVFKPVFSSLALRAPGLTRRAEFEDGEDRVRRTAHSRPHAQRLEIDIPRRDLGVFRRWFDEEIDGGRLWFRMPAFIDDGYREIEARIVDTGEGPYGARLVGDFEYRLSFELEIRDLPRSDDRSFAIRIWPSRPSGVDADPAVILDFANAFHWVDA